jgi:hypothetical protein
MVTMLSEAFLTAELEYRQRTRMEEAEAYRLARLARAAAPVEQSRLAAVATLLAPWRNRRDQRGKHSRPSEPAEVSVDQGGTTARAA